MIEWDVGSVNVYLATNADVDGFERGFLGVREGN